MSFALLTVVLATAMVALVLLIYYLLRRWLCDSVASERVSIG
jgi:hypothetical protein